MCDVEENEEDEGSNELWLVWLWKKTVFFYSLVRGSVPEVEEKDEIMDYFHSN